MTSSLIPDHHYEPLVFIGHFRVKEGKLDGYKKYYRQAAELTEASKPGTVAHLAYVNETSTELSIVHVFPDAESMELHMKGVDELANRAFEFMEIISFEIYGRPNEVTLETMKKIAGSGVALNLKLQHIGGYIHFRSG